MDHAGRYVFTAFNPTRHAAAVRHALWYITQRVAAILGLLLFVYGLLAAEVELAKHEQVTASNVR